MKEIFNWSLLVVLFLFTFVVFISCNKNNIDKEPALTEAEQIKHGEYLVKITGCNDCHTPDYPETNGEIPVEDWLVGSPVGWHGPWGTTYAINLRLYVNGLDQEQWLNLTRNIKSRPPMPWYVLHNMTESDLVDIYKFIKNLGPAGGPTPAYLPPGQQPSEPYISFPSQ